MKLNNLFADPITLGAITGIVANIPKEIMKLIFQQFGWQRYSYTQIAAGLFVPQDLVSNPLSLIFGAITDLTVAASLGVLTVYIIKNTGDDYPLFKGLLVGMMSYIFLYGLILELDITSTSVATPLPNFLALIQHIIFGLIMGWFIKRFGKLKTPEI
ncbi:hypothetical protein [Fuchsiella alkaliacetigena]|uniref:hypothetical protein n=1 Tax=Fuchsiella alkaliacetigena TaxID=957042 RepID=UPI00200AAA19|nr:hypothetical protein [Fuchsiella alkaliacetigena]MCK8825391.1 hypothetical protein [Fuchsiella alkaliacetigena]